MAMDEALYRNQFRKYIKEQIEMAKLQHKCHGDYLVPSPAQHKEESLKHQHKINEVDSIIHDKYRNLHHPGTSGGDADRLLHDSTFNSQHDTNSCVQCSIGDNNYSLKQLHSNFKSTDPELPTTNTTSRKCQATPIPEKFIGDYSFLFENDTNLGVGLGNVSVESAGSQKSSKTVISRKSSQDLRKIVASQCKLHELFDENLKQLNNVEENQVPNDNICRLEEQVSTQCPVAHSQCKRSTESLQPIQSHKDVVTEIGKSDLLECRHADTLTLSVDDVVNSKVVNPIIRKLQRMYLNNLKAEISLMEELERLPSKVKEVYKATIFKQKD